MLRKAPASSPADQVIEILDDLMLPLARLCVARGVTFAQAEEVLKQSFVTAAREGQPDAGKRDISRVSIATGINRREVTRLTGARPARRVLRMAPATQVYTHWLSFPEYRDARGRVRRLRRQGEAPSFESLAQGVTRDVHPRSLLDDLLRLGLAKLSDDGEWVEAVRDSVVPGEDAARMAGFLAANVGDHLSAAVVNVLSGEPRHFEQAVFSNKVSAETAEAVREMTRKHWSQVLAALVPAIEALIEADRHVGRPMDQRVRVGLFSYHEPTVEDEDDDEANDPT